MFLINSQRRNFICGTCYKKILIGKGYFGERVLKRIADICVMVTCSKPKGWMVIANQTTATK